MSELHRIYLSPGMFGFGTLVSYNYFGHLELALKREFRARGADTVIYVADVPPTASVRRRAGRLVDLVERTCSDDETDRGPIHFIGHSTGGLDARLVVSPSAILPFRQRDTWMPRVASVTTMNTPHYGTPIATFFATAKGQRMLRAVTALTVVVLSIGAPPMAAASALAMGLGRVDKMVGLELSVMDRVTEAVLEVLDEKKNREVRNFLDAIRRDQGAVVQLTPEAMDLFQAGVEDRSGVRYQSTISMVPVSNAPHWKRVLQAPWSFISAPVFASLTQISGRTDKIYPCAPAEIRPDHEEVLKRVFGRIPAVGENDGIVPIRSQLWGRIAWAGAADHLDVLGHFRGEGTGEHRDWLVSGASFDESAFSALVGAMVEGMIG